ncbi:MAG: ComEC family competence protein [Chlorobiaceae bacterium]|nr:ComEC family competence protein [Chlorobiaceae bacterium]
MRYYFSAHPSLRLLFFAVGGIMAGVSLPVTPLAWFFIALGACLMVFITRVVDRNRLPKGRLSLLSVLCYLSVVFSAFGFHASASFRLVPLSSLLSWAGGEVILSGFIDGRPVDGSGFTTLQLQVSEVFEAGRTTKVKEKVKVIVRQGDNGRSEYQEGEFVRVKGALGLIPVAANRGEYDPRFQNRLKGMHLQLFCAGPWRVLRESAKQGFSLYLSVVNPLRRYLADALDKNLPDGEERQFVKSMILGERDYLSEELYDAFRRTGTAHVLAVSGLHVVLLAYALNLCLQRLKVTSSGRWLSMVILVSVITLYSFVTGNAPSIKRAAIMSAMMIAGSTLGRKSWPVNSLAASDLVILLLDPFDLFSPGFLMTNGAVLGILVLYSSFSKMVPKGNGLLQYLLHLVWSAFSVSIAAMIGVSPVIAFYFGTFSVAGIVANLPVVLFSNLAMYAALPLFLFHGFNGWLASVFGASTWFFARLTLFFTDLFSRMPMASIEIRPDLFDVAVFYLFFALAFHAIGKKMWGRAAVVVLVGLNLLLWHEQIRPVPTPPGVLTVNLGRDMAVLFSSGNETCLVDAGRRTGNRERIWRQSEVWGVAAPVKAVAVFTPDSVMQTLPAPLLASASGSSVRRTFVVRRLDDKVVRIDSKVRSLLLVSGMERLEGQRADGADVVFWIYHFTGREWQRLDSWRATATPRRLLLVPGSFMTQAQRALLDRYAKSRPVVEVRSKSRQTAWY